MKCAKFLTTITLCTISQLVLAQVDWSHEAKLPGNKICFESHGHEVCLKDSNRENIYQLNEEQLNIYIKKGSEHALDYPVEVSELKLPKKALDKFFNSDSRSPLRRFIFKIAKKIANFSSWEELYNWIGLHDYPVTIAEQGPNYIASPQDITTEPMGVSIYDAHTNFESMSFSCATCHSSDLFGVKVLGMTNRFPRANEVFILGKKALNSSNALLFKLLIGASTEDVKTYTKSKEAMKYVQLKKPLTLGLDTSLAQVGLSLALRAEDEYATKIPRRRARQNDLLSKPADSKPAVWWNLKFKTKWLSDGSIVSGNPVHTNFLWNEIGRGVDLKKLERWLLENNKTIEELTAYVFHTKSPKFNDFFPEKINIDSARRGEKLYLQNCKGCHGIYEKAWSNQDVQELSYSEKIKTTKTWYHEKTPNIDVNTDEYRSQGMNYFANDLNRLKISKSIGTQVAPQKGYTPPPLVGIWARWPYFHNNSVPTLYDVLTPDTKRPKSYIAVDAIDKQLDFDVNKNGYPAPEDIREEYRSNKEFHFNTQIKGLSNKGHTKMMLDRNGNEKFSHEDKLDLISFLQTL